ncbi:TenA family protein [Subtercola sp. RTI3]|uniref:TenA family protein n=1 Tax=Subtercola sp. RTI3 TaxID=3048639 RepID=UPI002B2219F8|nr:TenA family protein [Subtercola sp. RTI3]MEA9984319.1 TenA family protein [Subtercola sp. RTI3]
MTPAVPSPANRMLDDWWIRIEPLRTAIDGLPFVRGLAEGTLEAAVFRNYLAQDALYLREYSRALARASQLAPTTAEQSFWATCAAGALVSELELHRSWLAVDERSVEASDVTLAYLNHLAAAEARATYPVLIAALLPCFWLYQDLGTRLVTYSHPAHAYASWLSTYADPAFDLSTQQAIEYVDAAAQSALPAERELMWRAFTVSSKHELHFFDQ